MSIENRIRNAVNNGVTVKSIASRAEVSYFRLKSVINPSSYGGSSSFDRFEEARINEALDELKNSI